MPYDMITFRKHDILDTLRSKVTIVQLLRVVIVCYRVSYDMMMASPMDRFLVEDFYR